MVKRKRHLGDRYDGRRLRSIDPLVGITPLIMKTRVGSQNFFVERADMTNLDAFLKAKRNAGMKSIRLLHIIIAALVRVYSQKPGMNRFVAGHQLYASNGISICFVVKKEMREDAEETIVKVDFEPTDTLYDVVERVNKTIVENKGQETSNDTDKFIRVISNYCPRFLKKFVVWLLLTLDYYGLMPKFVHKLSPFHASAIITDLGSLGVQSVYHHLYEVGTISEFIAFGTRKKERYIDKDNNIVERKYLDIKLTIDERINDGFYFAGAFKLFKKLVEHPERLELPPEQVVEDVD